MNTTNEAGVKPATEQPATPMQASLIEAQEKFYAAISKVNELAAIAPELHNWSFGSGGICGNLRLLQAHPSAVIGLRSLITQTSAMCIVRAVGIGQADVDGNGAIRCMVSDRWTLHLHNACAHFSINLPNVAEMGATT